MHFFGKLEFDAGAGTRRAPAVVAGLTRAVRAMFTADAYMSTVFARVCASMCASLGVPRSDWWRTS
jgi:hypothetical protein